jgi:hypothetical protein
VVRAAVVVLLALIVAYVTLPWWAPTGYIARCLAGGLSRQAGVAVHIDSISLSWSEGVEIRGLTVASEADFAPEPLAHIERIRADFSPIDIFLRNRIDWIELHRPRLFVRQGPDGRFNTAPLQRLQFDVRPRRVSLHQAVATLKLSHREAPLRLNVADAQLFPAAGRGFERITLAASLEQHGGNAPVSLQFTDRPMDVAARAAAASSFTNLDLAQFAPEKMLNLPVRLRGGRSDGRLRIRISREGLVDRVNLEVAIRDLDVQPLRGPALPVIGRAGLTVDAAVDPIADPQQMLSRLEVRSATVRLPGIDLSGKATAVVQLAPGEPAAQIASLDMTGRLFPDRLAALLTGEAAPPGAAFAGPVAIRKLSLSREGHHARILLAADATEAALSRRGRLLKPAGRKLTVDLDGDLDGRQWDFTINASRFRLGENTLEHEGVLGDVRPLLSAWLAAASEAAPAGGLADVHAVRSRGRWRIADLPALRDLSPALEEALGQVELAGELTGQWDLAGQHGLRGRASFQASMTAPPGTHLAVAGEFVKPPDEEMALSLSGRIVSRGARPGVRDVDVSLDKADLAAGASRLQTDGAEARFRTAAGGVVTVAVEAKDRRFDVERAESLLACVPRVAERLGGVAGNIPEGRYDSRPSPGGHAVRLTADLTDLAVKVKDLLDKPRGQRAAAVVDYTRQGTGKDRLGVRLSLHPPGAGAGPAPLVLTASGIPPGATWEKLPDSAEVRAELSEADAGWLSQTFPAAGRRVPAELELSGVALSGWVRGGAAGVSADLRCDADALQWRSGGHLKRRGTRMRLRLSGSLSRRDDDALLARLPRDAPCQLALGGSTLRLWGEAAFPPAERPEAPRRPELLDVHLRGTLRLDEALRQAMPEIAAAADEHAISGAADVSAEVSGHEGRVDVRAAVDATGLTVARAGPAVKPHAMPAALDVRAAVDLETLRLSPFRLGGKVGELAFSAAGAGRLERSDGHLRLLPDTWTLHADARTGRADTLHRLLPSLAEYALVGDVEASADWSGEAGGVVRQAQLRCRRLTGRYAGRDVSLAGAVTLGDCRPPARAGGLPRVGWLKTDGLHVRLGRSEAWLVADVSGLDGAPSGRAEVLAGYVDTQELLELASGGADEAEGASGTEAAWGLARQGVREARKLLSAADLELRLTADRLKTYDAEVREAYEVREVRAEATVAAGKVRAAYEAGLNGGPISGEYATDLSDPDPRIALKTVMTQLIATPSLQPQIAKFFPGNTVGGLFSRRKEAVASLERFLANVADARVAPRESGEAVTVATEGFVEGQAAPAFITRIFPALNLTRYRYRTMTGFADLKPDGSADNDMVFEGKAYDLYTQGTTDAENIGRYQVGVILLSAPQSPQWNHRYKLGRIPVFNFQARIEGGRMHDVKVSYLRPDEILGALLLTNNPLYRALGGK